MNYREIINELADKRLQLGMTDDFIARQGGLSQPTVNRILSGRHETARLDHILAIAGVLGMKCELRHTEDAERMRYERARNAARKIAEDTRCTMALEGQGLDKRDLMKLTEREIHKYLAGPNGKLWFEP